MTDYIDLVEKIRSFACKDYPNCEGCDTMGHECRSAIERQAADAIEELSHSVELLGDANKALMAAVPEWISVEERLPGERKWVLCQCRAKIQMVLRLQDGYWHQDSQHEFMRAFVTHWMPLPEPPKVCGP